MRSYSAHDIIALPTLSTAAAVALGQGLLTAAKAQSTLPALIAARRTALQTAQDALHQALSQKPQTPADPQRARNADIAEDQAWSALHDWMLGWGKVRGADGDQARAMYAILFPTRLKFTKLQYKLEWAEADARLARIASDGFDAAIEKLGGKPILEQLRVAHREYGDALGITAEGQDAGSSGLREPLRIFTASLRAYVLAVAAHADPADPASITLTEALLAPLHKWQDPASEPATAEPSAATPTATQPAAAAP
jgi:hypothetical protein